MASGARLTDLDAVRLAGRNDVARLGSLIRQTRQGRYSLEALAARARISPGLLSQIERGHGNPSFVTLCKLADALEMPLSSFFEFRGPAAIHGLVVRRSRRKKLVLPHLGLVYELLTPDLKRALTMVRTVVPPGFDNRERPFQHAGDECLLIVGGQLEVFVGREHFQLKEGDSITYDSGQQHWWHNRSPGKVEIIGALSPPVF
jgi:transcriptional regulator with XRE-family HTH domain